MKTPATFKLSKPAKTALAFINDKHRRAEVKKILIQGEYERELQARTRGRGKSNAE